MIDNNVNNGNNKLMTANYLLRIYLFFIFSNNFPIQHS